MDPKAIPVEIAKEVRSRLQAIEHDQSVRFLLAVESGSRAWGFPSPDSDFDVRFIYVRELNWYLTVKPGRDVIETPILDDIDLNGWDLRKAIGLMLKSNVIVSEWLESPIRYLPDDPQIEELRKLADQLFDSAGAERHYWSLARKQSDRWLDGADDVPVKKYFYALRPALSLRAMRLAGERRPPMNLQQLVAVCHLPTSIEAMIAELVAEKAVTRERSVGRRFVELDRFIRSELDIAKHRKVPRRKAEQVGLADRCFRSVLGLA